MNELSLGAYSLPLIVSLVLRWIYSLIGEEKLGNREKQIIPVILGVGLSYLYIAYAGEDWSMVNLVEKTLYGLINVGFAAIGFYEVTKK